MSTFFTSASEIPSVPDKTPYDTCTHCETSIASYPSIAEHGWVLYWGWISKGDDTATCSHKWFVNAERTQSHREQMKQVDEFVEGEFSSCNSHPAVVSLVVNNMSAKTDDEVSEVVQRYHTSSSEERPGVERLIKMLRDLSTEIGLEVSPLWVAQRLKPVSARTSGPLESS